MNASAPVTGRGHLRARHPERAERTVRVGRRRCHSRRRFEGQDDDRGGAQTVDGAQRRQDLRHEGRRGGRERRARRPHEDRGRALQVRKGRAQLLVVRL